MNIPLIRPYFTKDEEQEIINVIRSGWVMQGEKVAQFESQLANYIGVDYAVIVSSGTAALHLALLSLGINPGDEVIVPSFSFVATANSILYVGAKPIFADINPNTYNIDSNDIIRRITRKTKAIMVVHQIGLTADMDSILEIARRKKITVVEDAACALGAKYKSKMVGNFGKIACFSFHPRKSITTAEGGLVVTNDKKTAELIRSLRSHGIVKQEGIEKSMYLGYNYRMTDLQAAIGLAQFRKLDKILKKRQELAYRYNQAFKSIEGIRIPFTPVKCFHTYQSYLLRITGGRLLRDKVIKKLKTEGIDCRPSVTAIHKEPLYQKLFGKIFLPETEKANNEGLIIPLYPQMTIREQNYVIDTLKMILN